MMLKPLIKAMGVGTPRPWLPDQLFRAGEEGVWYDPSDLATLFQDAAGTIPVTADGDPVGRMEDKSGNAHHATQSTSAARPLYRRGDSRGVVNLLKRSEAFDNSTWSKSNISVTPNTVAAPNGELTADTIAGTGGTLSKLIFQTLTLNNTETFTFYAKENTHRFVQFLTGVDAAGHVNFDLQAGTVQSFGTYVGSITPAVDGWYRCAVTFTTSTGTAVDIGLVDSLAAARAATTASTNSVYLWGAQLEQGSTATAYQRNDSHLGGVATGQSTDLHWLEFDGVDDYMDIAALSLFQNVTAGTISAAVLPEVVNGTTSAIMHFSSGSVANQSRLALFSSVGSANLPTIGGRRLDADSFVGVNTTTQTGSAVLTGEVDWANSNMFLRRDGAQVSQNLAFQTDGATSNTASLAAKLGTLSTSEYGQIYLYGAFAMPALLGAAQRFNLERYLANKSGVAL